MDLAQHLAFVSSNPLDWAWPEVFGFCVFIFLMQGVMAFLINVCFSPVSEIPIKQKAGDNPKEKKYIVKVLEEFETIDHVFIMFNKLVTTVFTYQVYAFAWNSSNVEWDPSKLNIANTIGAMVGLYLVYDFFYTLFHRLLHVRGLYKWVHKHHHRQMAPFRGNLDAINVHPFEFVTGEYLHLLCLWVVPTHVYTILVFITFDGIFASLNHTRFNVIIPPSIFAVKAHDTHHHLPNWNFGQYLTVWDRIFGTYKDHWMDLKKE
uniref:Fatty acid hydroxylase domain-containing protein n=1 Tax=Paramoeba aestuarina TaxID=180227 RepID=A0A7S4U8M5_9EUKA